MGCIPAPAPIVLGAADFQPMEVASDYAGGIEDWRVAVIDEAGHYQHWTHAGALARL